MHAQEGPTSGNTKIVVEGYGFKQVKFDNGTYRGDVPIYARFNDMQGNPIGEPKQGQKITNEQFVWYSPPANVGTKAIMSVSFDQQNWQQVIPSNKDHSFLYFNAPQVTAIEPHFGPVKSKKDEVAILHGRNFVCPENDCSQIFVRFGYPNNATYVPGKWLSESQIQVIVPKYTKPDVLPVDVTLNDQDFTNDNVTYGFFDPFLLDVTPRLIPARGGTRLTLHGFGFVNSEADQIESLFGTKKDGDLNCNAKTPCITKATFESKNILYTDSLPKASLTLASDGTALGDQGFTVDASVYQGGFTDAKIVVWYIHDLEYQSLNRNDVPKNLQVPLIISTEFHWDLNDYEKFTKYSNFTCRFKIGTETIYTTARMDGVPLGSMYDDSDGQVLPNAVVCPSPKTKIHGKARLDISFNGQDFGGDFEFEFTDPVDLYRMTPQCGPRGGNTKTKLLGSGFATSKYEVHSKFGVIGTQKIVKEQVINWAW